MKLTIDKKLKSITPDFYIGGIIFEVTIFDNIELNKKITEIEHSINDTYNISDVIQIPIIKDGRNAYKKYGKDPSRYRLAVESLFRRLSKGNKLYRINNVVDTGNLLSIHTMKSVAVVDFDQLQGDVFVRLGTEADTYTGIGRGLLNITNIPLYEDDISPFGSVTSDTDRTKITNKTKKILVLIISFSGMKNLIKEQNTATELFVKYCDGVEVTRFIE